MGSFSQISRVQQKKKKLSSSNFSSGLKSEGSAALKNEEEEGAEVKNIFRSKPLLRLITNNAVKRRIAVIDDDEGIHLYLQEALEAHDFKVKTYFSAEEFLQEFKQREDQHFVDIVLCDLRLPGIDGISLIPKVKELSPDIPVVLMTAFADVDSAVRAIRDGAYDYLEKPFESSRLLSVLENALRFRKLSFENARLYQMFDSDLMVRGVFCQSAAMKSVYSLVRQILSHHYGVLLWGEWGVGKAEIARMIHENGPRSTHPFLVLDAYSTPDSLFESELFGQINPSSSQTNNGLIERARGGAVFINGVDHLPMPMQLRLLEILKETEMASEADLNKSVKFIASTSVDLLELVKLNKFNEDLYYAISRVSIQIPPLRHRKEDIPILAQFFLDQMNKEKDLKAKSFTNAALKKISRFDLPKNLNELRKIVEKSAELCQKKVIGAECIPSPVEKYNFDAHPPMIVRDSFLED